MSLQLGRSLYDQVVELFPINRSLTGDGIRCTLEFFKRNLPELTIHEVPSGTQAFDWSVPAEWRVRDAFIADLNGNQLVSFKENNLHLVGYSVPINKVLPKSELEEHLHSLPNQRDAIPYVTSYYSPSWGFCLTQNQREQFGPGPFHVFIDSQLFPGSMSYGELIIPGSSNQEVLLTTYVCHPSMASNELSGPVVLAALAKWLFNQKPLKYTYRILFLAETIGSIYYLSKHLEHLKRNVIAGWVLTCLGDDRTYSYIPSRSGNTLTDRISKKVLSELDANFREFTWLDRGSDERQFCSPGIDLPVGSIMRSKYDEFPEYHTSLDNLDYISPEGLQGGFIAIQNAIITIEKRKCYKLNIKCEPQLSKRGLYPSLSTKKSISSVYNLMNVISFLDGNYDIDEVAYLCKISRQETEEIIEILIKEGLVDQ